MKHPELLFGVVVLLVVGYLIKIIRLYIQNKNVKQFIGKLVVSILIIILGRIWFVPVYVTQKGETSICKFRFQVFEYDLHDYSSYGNFSDVLLSLKPNKYGQFVLYKRLGGIKAYFGFKKVNNIEDKVYFKKEFKNKTLKYTRF